MLSRKGSRDRTVLSPARKQCACVIPRYVQSVPDVNSQRNATYANMRSGRSLDSPWRRWKGCMTYRPRSWARRHRSRYDRELELPRIDSFGALRRHFPTADSMPAFFGLLQCICLCLHLLTLVLLGLDLHSPTPCDVHRTPGGHPEARGKSTARFAPQAPGAVTTSAPPAVPTRSPAYFVP